MNHLVRVGAIVGAVVLALHDHTFLAIALLLIAL